MPDYERSCNAWDFECRAVGSRPSTRAEAIRQRFVCVGWRCHSLDDLSATDLESVEIAVQRLEWELLGRWAGRG
jgi:hypothetical protein